MKITPIDIQQQQFKGKMFGGLDQDDVDAFLQTVAAEMENLLRENSELKEQESRQKREFLDLAEKEKELREIMLAAQRITEEMKNNARKEGELIITEAELKAERIVANANRQFGDLKAAIEELQRQKIQFECAFKAQLDCFMRQLTPDESA